MVVKGHKLVILIILIGLGDKVQSWYRQRSVKQYLYMTAVLLVWTVHFCLGTHSMVLFNLRVLMKQFVIK